jgi:MFS family permease
VTPPPELERLARRITHTLFLGMSLGSAGFLAASTVNAIVGAQLSGRPAWAGLPTAVYQAGVAGAALLWGQAMDRLGRRPTLVLGLTAGAAGAGLAGVAVGLRSLAAFLTGVLLMGAAQSALQLGRFVAAEVHPPEQRGRAIARVVLGGTVGGVLGPLLVGPSSRLAGTLGLAVLAGPYLASALLFVAALAVTAARLRPEPRELARQVAAALPSPVAAGPARPLGEVLGDARVRSAMAALVFSQVVMTMVMVITSLHMTHHGHGLGNVSLVLSLHVTGMFALSLLTGRLTDRWGRAPVIALGGGLLIVACLLAPLSPRLGPLTAALFLLGLGWNLCFVGGSSLLADRLRPEERARTQGLNDTLIGLAAAGGGLGSGAVFAAVGYGAMALLAAAAALVPLILALRMRRVAVARLV